MIPGSCENCILTKVRKYGAIPGHTGHSTERRKLIILGSEVETMHEYSYVVPGYDSGRDDSFEFAS